MNMPLPGRQQFITYTTAILFGIASAFASGAVIALGAIAIDPEHFASWEGLRKLYKIAAAGGVNGVVMWLLYLAKSGPSVLPGKGTVEPPAPHAPPAAADPTTTVTTTTTVQETSAPVPEASVPVKPPPYPPIQN